MSRRVSARTTAPSAPYARSSHMNQKRSWPGVPKRYRASRLAIVIRPKSIATVVVVLSPTPLRSSTPTLFWVSASSVRSGRISLIVLTSVVLPTPNPPATRILKGVNWLSSGGPSEGTEPIEYLLEQVGARLGAWSASGQHGDHLLLDQVGQQHPDDAEGQRHVGRHVGHGPRLLAQAQELAVLRAELGRLGARQRRAGRGDDRDHVEHRVADRVSPASGQRVRPDDRTGFPVKPPVVLGHGGLTRPAFDARPAWAGPRGAARPA